MRRPPRRSLSTRFSVLEILDRVQLMAVDPPGEHHEQQLKRLKRWGHCSEVYRLTNHRASSSSRLAHCPIASFEFLDTTGVHRCEKLFEGVIGRAINRLIGHS